jgi:hypothetical protein
MGFGLGHQACAGMTGRREFKKFIPAGPFADKKS